MSHSVLLADIHDHGGSNLLFMTIPCPCILWFYHASSFKSPFGVWMHVNEGKVSGPAIEEAEIIMNKSGWY